MLQIASRDPPKLKNSWVKSRPNDLEGGCEAVMSYLVYYPIFVAVGIATAYTAINVI